MAQVVKVSPIGFGSLEAGASTWWNWKITDNDVWLFWVDTHGAQGNNLEIVSVRNYRQQPSNNWAYVNIKNVGKTPAPFSLNVARIY